MRSLCLAMAVLCTGCATMPRPIVEVPKVQPGADIMKSCEVFVDPVSKQPKYLLAFIFEKKKQYQDCSEQNEAKKAFIIKY